MPNSSYHQHKIPVFWGTAALQNMAQATALAAHVASTAAVLGRTAFSPCIASVPRARMPGPTTSF